MHCETPSRVEAGFKKHATESLRLFSFIIGQCVPLCAHISAKLTNDDIPHSVALGSLSCNGIKTFQYVRAFPSNPQGPVQWDGHAWIEFPDGYIGEPSLLRTARTQQIYSNLRQHFERLGMIELGAFLMNKEARDEARLKYIRKKTLDQSMFPRLIAGLEFLNQGE
jgi:hypothetical protein